MRSGAGVVGLIRGGHSLRFGGPLQRAILLAMVLVLALLVLKPFDEIGSLGRIDYLQYWSSSQALLQGENPYDPEVLRVIQGNPEYLVLLWNPPLIFPVIFPLLAGVSELFGQVLWGGLNIIIILGSALILWKERLRDGPSLERKRAGILFLLFLATSPSLWSALYFGQVSFILLLSVTLFFYFGKDRGVTRTFWGGLALSLTLIKPHLLYLLYLFILVRSLQRRHFQTLFGLGVGVGTLALLATLINPHVWEWYLHAISVQPPIFWKTPNLGTLLQEITDIHNIFIRALPMVVSSFLSLCFFSLWKLSDDKTTALYLLPLSHFTSLYGWVYDMLVVFPFVVFGVNQFLKNGGGRRFWVLGTLLFSLNLVALWVGASYSQDWLFWYLPGVIGLVWLSFKSVGGSPEALANSSKS